VDARAPKSLAHQHVWAAVRAAQANRLQTSMNLALGSALASIGLTVPAVAVASRVLDQPLTLGLQPKDVVLLVLTVVVSIMTVAPPSSCSILVEIEAEWNAGKGQVGRIGISLQDPLTRRAVPVVDTGDT